MSSKDEIVELAHEALDAAIEGDLSAERCLRLTRMALDALTPLPEPIDTVVDVAVEASRVDVHLSRLAREFVDLLRRDPAKLRKRARKAARKGRVKASRRLRRAARHIEERG